MVLGFVLELRDRRFRLLAAELLTPLRRIDRATVAGYYGSDSAGTFATCVAVLGAVGIAFNAYMPVMLAVMEIPGCLVALYLVARLRHRGMDSAGNMPDEPGYTPPVKVGVGPGTAKRPRVRPEPRDPARTGYRAGAGVLDGKAGASRTGSPTRSPREARGCRSSP